MTTTVATDRPPSVPVVDLSLLSQSELYTLSLSSDAYDLNHDLVIPKINRAVFNESAGSRKQTYSRLRLASDDVTKTTTLHRRTPHLRTPVTHPANNNNNNINDPEQAENTTIIRMLKQLCKSDPNFQDIDMIDDDNDNNDNITIPVAAEFLNHETLGLKRKRGRPRKHENVVFIRPPTGKRIRDNNNINSNDTFVNAVKKEAVFDDEKDKDIVSENGAVVDLVGLGGLEDPYGEEIRRRTVGMTTEDELLGFLRGLNGHWGSRRRKRRVVAAAEFGDVLPKGWKMSLCIKKKEGRVWLFCRRYLSPSGRQFESFKEISTYLISVIGEENLDKQNILHANGSNESTLKEASTANLVQQEDIKRDDPVDNPPPPSPRMPPVTVNCEVQVKNDCIGSRPQTVPANCEVQVSLDAMEAQVDTNVKSDHNGPHVENETEKTDSLPAELDNSVLVSPGDTALVETDDPHSGDKINERKESNTDELVQDLNVLSNSKQDEHTDIDRNIIMDNEASRTEFTEQPVDDTVSQSELLGDDVMLTMNDKSNIEPETSGEINVNSVDNKPDFNLDQDNVSETGWQRDGGGCGGDENIAIATSVGMVDLPAPGAIVEKASICEEKGFDANMDMDINNTSNELISEMKKVDAESSSGIFLDRFGLDKDGATVVKGIDSVKAVNAETLSSFQEQESDGTYNNNNAGLTSSRLAELFDVGTDAFDSYEENELNNNLELDVMQIDSNKSEEVKLDDFNIFRNNEPKRTEGNVLDFNTKSNLEFCSLVPSENEQEFGFQDCLYDDTMEERKEESSERGLLNHFSDDIFENKMYSTPLDGLKFDEDRDLNSNELSLAFGNSNVNVHTNLSMVNSSMVEDLKSGSGSVGGLFNLSGNVKTSSFQTSWDGIKSDEFKFKSSGSKFNTAFGSNPGQSHEEVVPNGMWRTGDGSQLQSGLTIPSHAHIPSPSSYHSFNIMPGKAGGGQFRLDERYNEGYGVTGLRSSRPGPVEFSFLTPGSSQHNPHHQLQGDSRAFPYNSGMDQQFNNFWLGKNTMMPNPTGRNQMAAVCALCRNEFHLHPAHFSAQNGIAPLCPSCSAGMSGHGNLL